MTQPNDADVIRYIELTEQIESLDMERNEIKMRFRQLEPGKHEAVGGVMVNVSLPPRTFNAERAWSMLTDDQKDVCTSPDPKKVKAQLSQVLVDACMDEGKGEPRVVVK